MLTKDEILAVLKKQMPMLRERFYVQQIGLFGSFARGEATEKSDIDFLVVIDADMGDYANAKSGLHEYLQELFGRKVDLANPRSLKPYFKERILKQAIYA